MTEFPAVGDKMRIVRAQKRQKMVKTGKNKSMSHVARAHMAHVNKQMAKCYPDA